ncbi:MAG: hypothetical protein AB1641_28460 [Thermodesulfobacteriota bacterium]
MAAKVKTSPLRSQTWLFLLLGAVILGAVLFGLYPQNRALGKQEEEKFRLEADIEKQKLLHPLYTELYQKAKFERPAGLPLPPRKKLPRDRIGQLNAIFLEAARQSGLEFEKVLPQVNSLNMNTGLLMVDVFLKGDFLNLRKFVVNMAQMPFVEHLERLNVRRVQGGDSIQLRLWLALE